MALPDSYTVKPNAIPAYFDALLNAEAPERFSYKFLSNLEFKSTNDRLFIGILKDLGFIDTDGVPTPRYFEFLDRSQSSKIVAVGVRDAYSDLFTVNKDANSLGIDEVKNKLRTLYAGSKKDGVLGRISSTFVALCEYADFSGEPVPQESKRKKIGKKAELPKSQESEDIDMPAINKKIKIGGLQYHINIVLPESRDQAVYDAIFKALREHLG